MPMTTQAYFENIRPEIAKNLENAQESIFLAVAWFTDNRLLEILEQKAQKGLKIELILLEDEINERLNFEKLQNLGGKVWKVFDYPNLMHHKFCVIDQKIVLNGSYNWTIQASKNDEDLTITQNKELAKRFGGQFDRLKQKYSSMTEISPEEKRKRLLAFINANLKKIQTLEYSINAALQELKNIEQGYETTKFKKLFLKLRKKSYEESAKMIEQLLEDTNSEEMQIWWNNISPKWQKVLLINAAFEEKGIDYQYIMKENWRSETSENIYRKVYRKDFKMPKNLNLSKLKSLRFIWCCNEKLTDLEPLGDFKHLQVLCFNNNQISTLEPLRDLSNLQELYFRENKIRTLEPLQNLTNLKELDCYWNPIRSLEPLQNLIGLLHLKCHFDEVYSLQIVRSLISINGIEVEEFLSELKTWWKSLSPKWREILAINALLEVKKIDYQYISQNYQNDSKASEVYKGVFEKPSFEFPEDIDLLLLQVRSLKFVWCPKENLTSLQVLRPIENLEMLNISYNKISDLRPLRNLTRLQVLRCTDNQISSFKSLKYLEKLKELNCKQNKIDTLEGLQHLSTLEKLECDDKVCKNWSVIFDMQSKNKKIIINTLKNEEILPHFLGLWWKDLSVQWQKILAINIVLEEKNIHEQIAKKYSSKKVAQIYYEEFGKAFRMPRNIDWSKIKDLKKVCCQNEDLKNLEPLRNLKNLKVLYCGINQIKNLKPLQNLTQLEYLDCDLNEISSLEVLENLQHLQNLSCWGNQISSLEPLRKLSKLQKLDCKKNQISSLEPLWKLSNLQELWLSTDQISPYEIEKFEQLHKHNKCEVFVI